MKTALIAVLTMVACGGPSRPEASEPAASHDAQKHDMRHAHHMGGDHMGGDHMGGMMGMSPEVKAFHDVLAPRWHAEHGAKRMADTCTAIPELRTRADAIAKAAPPERVSPQDWSGKGKQLGEAVTALEAACKAGDADGFEPAFTHVHEAFHAVMSAGHGGHGKHGEHGGGEGHEGHDKGKEQGKDPGKSEHDHH